MCIASKMLPGVSSFARWGHLLPCTVQCNASYSRGRGGGWGGVVSVTISRGSVEQFLHPSAAPQLLFQEKKWNFHHQYQWLPQPTEPLDQGLHYQHSCTNSQFLLTLREFPEVDSANIMFNNLQSAMLWYNWLVTGLSLRTPDFDVRLLYVGFVAEEVALRHHSLEFFGFFVINLSKRLHTHSFIHHRGYIILILVSVVEYNIKNFFYFWRIHTVTW